jgi:hypothetical protein
MHREVAEAASLCARTFDRIAIIPGGAGFPVVDAMEFLFVSNMMALHDLCLA